MGLRRISPSFLAATLALLTVLAEPVLADSPPSSGDVEQRLRVAQRAYESITKERNGTDAKERLAQEVELLKQLKVITTQLDAARQRTAVLEANVADAEAQLKALRGRRDLADEDASFLLLDQLRDELATHRERGETLQAEVAAAEDALRRAKTLHDEKERRRRLARESAEGQPPPLDKTTATKSQQAHELAVLDSQLAAAVVTLREVELANHRTAARLAELSREQLQVRIDQLAPIIEFRRRDLDEQLDRLRKREAELQTSLDAAQESLSALENAWLNARLKLDLATDDKPVVAEEVDAHQRARQAQQRRIALLTDQLRRLGRARAVWRQRFDVLSGTADEPKRVAWREEARHELDELGREFRLQIKRAAELRAELAAIDAKLQPAKQASSPAAPWLEQQRQHVAAQIDALNDNLVSIEASRRLHEKLLAEMHAGYTTAGVESWLAWSWTALVNVWNYELTHVDDRPITVSKLFWGVLLLVLGWWASRRLSRLFGRRLLPRFKLHEGASAALESLAFYMLVVTFTLFALRIVNVPLTAFTILGGALAVGVGFGSQNIVNNFISGLILLAERPIRVGDMIEWDKHSGTVEHIGARSTRVRTGSNMEIIVPNSTFLQSNVVNWTLSDDKIRTLIRVGVAYGTATRELKALLKKAADEHGLVLSNPEPFVLFVDFGDNCLVFELHFWIQMRSLSERRRIESDLRFKIDQLLRDAGIAIPFPQRDVHLDVRQPLDIRILDAGPAGTGGKRLSSDAA